MTPKQILTLKKFKSDLDSILSNYSKFELVTNVITIKDISEKMNMSRQTFYKYLEKLKK